MRHRRSSIVCGCLISALAASVMAVKVPYYAIFAGAALMIVLFVWVAILARSAADR